MRLNCIGVDYTLLRGCAKKTGLVRYPYPKSPKSLLVGEIIVSKVFQL